MHISVYKIDKQQVLLYSTGNSIQYLVINHNGKDHEKEYIYIKCITESFCCTPETNTTFKSTVLQLKKTALNIRDADKSNY